MQPKKRHISLRLDDEIRRKFRYVANFQGLSANAMLNHFIHNTVINHEKEYGKITEEDLNKMGLDD